MLSKMFSVISTSIKIIILIILFGFLYNQIYLVLPKEQQRAIHNFCRNFDIFQFDSSSGKVFKGKACDYDSQVITSSCQNAVILDGTIGFEMYEDLKSAIENKQMPNQLICLRSPGGVIEGAEKIAELIRSQQINTCLSDYVEYDAVYEKSSKSFKPITKQSHNAIDCTSACPFILIAGKNRTALGDNFTVKLHHPGTATFTCAGTIYSNADLSKKNGLLNMVKQSPADEFEQHQMLYQRAVQTNFRKFDNVCHCDFEKYRLFTTKPSQ